MKSLVLPCLTRSDVRPNSIPRDLLENKLTNLLLSTLHISKVMMSITYGTTNTCMTGRCESENMLKLDVIRSRTVDLQRQIYLNQRQAFFDYTLFVDVVLREGAVDIFITFLPSPKRKDLIR